LRNDIDLIEKNKLKLLDEARALSEKNLIILSSKETHEKQTENLIKINNKLNKEIFEIQVEIDSKLNEIARVEIDKLNVETQNEALKKKLKLMDNEITKLENLYSTKEQEIKKNHEDLEKKQLNVDKLNKKFGELTKNKGGEDEGLYEVKIKELQSELQNLNKKIQESEQEWIVKKTNLVAKEGVLNTIEEECVDKRSKKMILDHKKLRLNKNYEMHEKEIREIEISLKNLRYDMNRYNGQLGKNVGTKEKLTHQFFDVEIEFKEKLKQMENESIRLELEIEVLREEKADTLTQIMEVERQIHLWDRKIQLEEKMQEIIKPDKGIKEIDEMKSIIHRQDLLYTKLKQEQERVIKNMEMAIERREFIKVRYPVDQYGANVSKDFKKSSSSSFANRELNELKDQFKHIVNKKNIIQNNLINTRNAMDEINGNIESIEIQSKEFQLRVNNYQNEFIALKLKSNSLFCKTKQNQDSTKMLEDFKDNKFKPRRKNDLIKEIEKFKNETELVLNILKNFKDTHPEYSDIISEAMKIIS
jgi:chromosome segregation ATPase